MTDDDLKLMCESVIDGRETVTPTIARECLSRMDRIAELESELKDANYWRDRHCHEAEAAGQANIKNWKRIKELEAALQDKCHGFPETDYVPFCDGCDWYQREKFGKCRTDDLKAEVERLKRIPMVHTGGPCPCCHQPEGSRCSCGPTLREVERLRADAERIIDADWERFCRDHLPPSRLFRIVMGMDNGDEEGRRHLAECDRCSKWAAMYRIDAVRAAGGEHG